MFRPANRQKSRLRMAIDGPSGGGKTFTALRFAFALGKRVAVINTESGAVEKYLGLAPDGIPWQFDICELSTFAPTSYTQAIMAAGAAGYDVLVIDSLSHAWAGSGGALELVDRRSGTNSFTAWKDITPMHNAMIEAILRSPCHVIVTMRSKTEYVLEEDGRGKKVPRKIGMAPVQRQGMEYEFDLYASMDSDHVMHVSKSRCPHATIVDGVVVKPNAQWLLPVVEWLNDGLEIDPSAFAVTDADLEKFANRNTSAINNANVAKQISPMELLKKAQASQPTQNQVATAAPANSNQGEDTSFDPSKFGESQAGVGVLQVPVDGPCTQAQLEQVASLLNDLEEREPGAIERYKANLTAKGIQRTADLSIIQCRDLIAHLETSQMEEFFATTF